MNLLKRRDELLKNLFRREGGTEDSELRTGIVFAHGGNNNAWTAGVCNYLEQRSFSMGVDVMVTVNPVAGFLQARQTHGLRDLFCRDLCSKEFISGGFLRKIVRIDFLESYIRAHLDVDTIQKNPTQLYVGVTTIHGHGELINIKASNVDIVDALIATVTLPVKESPPKIIGGEGWVTGSLAMPIPALEAVEKFKLTDLLVVLNDPSVPFKTKHSSTFIERHSAPFYIHPLTPGLLKAYLNRKNVCLESLARATGGIIKNCRVRVIAPPPDLKTSKLCTRPDILNRLYLMGHSAAQHFFGDVAPSAE